MYYRKMGSAPQNGEGIIIIRHRKYDTYQEKIDKNDTNNRDVTWGKSRHISMETIDMVIAMLNHYEVMKDEKHES